MTEEFVATVQRYNEGATLFRVVSRSASRIYVEKIEGPGHTHGSPGKPFIHGHDAIPVRDHDHFLAIGKALKEYRAACRDIEATAADKKRKALARYEEAIA